MDEKDNRKYEGIIEDNSHVKIDSETGGKEKERREKWR